MSRPSPPDRLQNLVGSAAVVFAGAGYGRSQMDDVARELGVSKGTLYRHVTSKESLFGAVIRYGDGAEPLPDDAALPTVTLEDVITAVHRGAEASAHLLREDMAAHAGPVADAAYDLAVRSYERNHARRTAIMVFDRCAPEIDPSWFELGRYAQVDAWAALLQRFDPNQTNPAVLARTIVELITLWSVKMPWDPSPRAVAVDAPDVGAMVRSLVKGNSP
jgi:AcrR family transcriptional regulator